MARAHDTNRFTNTGMPRFYFNDIDVSAYITDIIYSGGIYDQAIRISTRPDAPIYLRGEAPIIEPIPVRLYCPECGKLHVDIDEWATRPHHTHACQECGNVWRPVVVDTVGVKFLPGFHD